MDAELGYAVTGLVAQGRTVITGAEDRPHALVALTRAPPPTWPTSSPDPRGAPRPGLGGARRKLEFDTGDNWHYAS
jgi:hypothetical protein